MFKDLLNLFFPPVCEACKTLLSDNEVMVCTSCRHELPMTNFHFSDDNSIKKLLYGRIHVQLATALLYFSKQGITQELLHNLKYRGHEQIGQFLGEWLGAELKTINDYNTIDAVIPVPLHKRKLRQRGYNQVAKFGKCIAEALNADYNNRVLLKVKDDKTQVFKDRSTRYEDLKSRFSVVNTDNLKHKHVLLVDDIITTGATMEACASLLSKVEGVKISIATMAIAE